MIRLAAISVCVLAATATASANATFYNATAGTLTVEATFPNGKVEKRRINDGSETSSSGYFLVPPGVDKIGIRIFDDVGTELWKGSSGPNDVHVSYADGKATKTVFAGLYSGTFDTPKAVVFMNVTGEPLAIDLEGMNGIGAHRGIPTGPMFDLKKIVRLDPKETYFTAQAKGKGEPITIKSTRVQAGRYYLITRHSHDTFRLLSLGYLAPPPSAKKK